MFKKLLKLVMLLLLTVFLIVTLAFTSRESKNVPCRDINVSLSRDDEIQLSTNEIIRLVKSADKNLIGKRLEEIDTEIIEHAIEKHRAVKKAEVFKVVARDSSSYKGVLGVHIKHRKPVVRIMASSGTYYLDQSGEKFPVSVNYSANVLVATGKIDEQYAREKLLPFVLYVEDHPFWSAQIEQVHVEGDGDIILTPLVGNLLIELGPVDDYSRKLRNARAFYNEVISKNNWETYSKVSVKFKNQVIAKKR